MATLPLIVSLWRGRDKQDLLCSGLLLTGRHILTVRHAFTDWPDQNPVYVRLIDGVDGDVTARVLQCHPERDAAILQLETAVGPIASPDLLTRSDRSLDGQAATLRVIDPQSHGRSNPSSYSVANFDHGTGEYVVTPEDARGHSGGVLEVDGRVIGLLSRRRQADPLCRAVAMHLLWPWIQVTIGLASTEHGQATPPPTGPVSPAYGALVVEVGRRVREILDHDGTKDLAPRWGADPLAGFDLSDPGGQLRILLNGLYKATAESKRGWQQRAVEVRAEIRQDCGRLLSELVKLAVDPGASQEVLGAVAAAAPERLHLACEFGGTADLVYCALADVTHLLTRPNQDRDIRSGNAVALDDLLPSGEGADLRQEILKKLWTQLMPYALPGRIDGKDYKLLLARIQQVRDRDGRRYFLTAPGPSDWCEHSDRRRWADELHLGLVLHEDGQCRHLLLDEPQLINNALGYLELLESL